MRILDDFIEEFAVAIFVFLVMKKSKVELADGSWMYEGEAPYWSQIRKAEDDNGIPPRLLAALLWQESHFRDDIIKGDTVSPTGALGIAQFMPATAQEQLGTVSNALNPALAIPAAARYLVAIKRYLDARGGDGWRDAVIAYNWGMGNAAKWIAGGRSGTLPGETSAYVSNVYDENFA